MEVLNIQTSSATPPKLLNPANKSSISAIPNTYSSLPFPITVRNRRKLIIVEAKKKKNTNNSDTHSFAPKPDEAIGLFPEYVLLKQKNVQEDGRLLPEFADAEEEELFEFLNLQLESDLNVERMRHYEVVYLVHEDHGEEVGSIKSKVEDFLRDKKGKVWRLNDWGLRRLAYQIKKAKNAYYILMNFELEAKWINDFKSMLDKDERVIRHLVIKRDAAITEDCPPPPEIHTLRAGMDDDDYYDEDDDEDWDDDEELDLEEYDEDDDDIILVNAEDEDDEVDKNTKPANTSNVGRRNRRIEKVGR